MFRNFRFCSRSSSDAVVDDMHEIERVWVGVGVKIQKSGNVEITARSLLLKCGESLQFSDDALNDL